MVWGFFNYCCEKLLIEIILESSIFFSYSALVKSQKFTKENSKTSRNLCPVCLKKKKKGPNMKIHFTEKSCSAGL